MKSSLLKPILAILLMVSIVTPATFFVAPHRAEAQWAVIDAAVVGTTEGDWIENALNLVQNTLSAANTYVTRVAQYADMINKMILQPIALVMAIIATKSLTASVLSFVIGNSNGTGAPQFVQNLQGNLQRVGDSQALAFFAQFGRNSNSPFASSISSALRTNYLQNTSMAGFWAANRNTLPQFTNGNPGAFLSGNWSKGGVGAWFALTTQTQNNPYTFYQTAQSQMGSVVASAQAARSAALSFGQGFMSWCGTSDAATQVAEASATAAGNMAAMAPKSVDCTPATQSFVDAMGSCYASAADAAAADAANNASEQLGNVGAGRTATGGIGVNPGDSCTNKDGTPGKIQTPGTTIKATLDKVLGANQDRLTQIGNMANNIGGIISGIGTIFNTVQFAQQILGGQSSGGLAGVGYSSGPNSPSVLSQYQNTPAAAAAANAVIAQSISSSALGSTSDVADRVTKYESTWDTIKTMVTAAAANVTDLKNFCTAAATTDPSFSAAGQQAAAAQTALDTIIAPILTRDAAARVVISNARAAIQQADADKVATDSGAATRYAADLQKLQTMPPTDSDAINIQQEIKTGPSKSTDSPKGSLNISGGSILDQMVLVNVNASALKANCVPQGSSSSGGGA